jgi:hypothetical protein
MNRPNVVSQAEWLAARKELLAREKEFTGQRDELSAASSPWLRSRRSMFSRVRRVRPSCLTGRRNATQESPDARALTRY